MIYGVWLEWLKTIIAPYLKYEAHLRNREDDFRRCSFLMHVFKPVPTHAKEEI
jgi:hypothetical protein